MAEVFVGIDPGKGGAVAVLGVAGQVTLYTCPVIKTSEKLGKSRKTGKQRYKRSTHYDERGMLDLLIKIREEHKDHSLHVLLEEVSAQPNDGRVAAFAFGVGFGYWRMALVAADLPYTLVRPHVWRPKMVGAKKDKKHSLVVAKRLFPRVQWAGTKQMVDCAEALLMALYLQRAIHNEPSRQLPLFARSELRSKGGKKIAAGENVVILTRDVARGRVDVCAARSGVVIRNVRQEDVSTQKSKGPNGKKESS